MVADAPLPAAPLAVRRRRVGVPHPRLHRCSRALSVRPPGWIRRRVASLCHAHPRAFSGRSGRAGRTPRPDLRHHLHLRQQPTGGSPLSWMDTAKVAEYVDFHRYHTGEAPAAEALRNEIAPERWPFVGDAESHLIAWHNLSRRATDPDPEASMTPATARLDQVQQVHALLMHNSSAALPGRLRDHNVYFSGAYLITPVPMEMHSVMGRLIDWIRTQSRLLAPPAAFRSDQLCSADPTAAHACVRHPALFAALASLNFVHVHPFADGNGRMSRLLLNWALLASRLPPTNIRSQNGLAYRRALALAGRQSHHQLKQTPTPMPFIKHVIQDMIHTIDGFNKEIRELKLHVDRQL